MLSGIQVLDFTRLIPGPFATLMLADMGAEVIKVEDPGAGDYLRWLGAPLTPEGSALFHHLNRGKRGIILDLKHPGAVLAARRLAARADVLVESFRPGVMERLGLGDADLKAENRRLVYASITGYGQTGSRAARAGHDIDYLAVSGLASLTGDPPRVLPFQLADLVGGGLMAVSAILAALLEARTTGRGRRLDVAMTHAVTSLTVQDWTRTLAGGEGSGGPDLLGGSHPGYGYYRCRDGRYLAVAALEPKFWERLCEAVGVTGEPDPFVLEASRWSAVRSRLEEIFLTRSSDEWMTLLGPLDCCVEKVQSVEEAVAHPHFEERGTTIPVEVAPGRIVPLPGPWFQADPDLEPARVGGPARGEHTREVLAGAGLSEEEITDLVTSGALGST